MSNDVAASTIANSATTRFHHTEELQVRTTSANIPRIDRWSFDLSANHTMGSFTLLVGSGALGPILFGVLQGVDWGVYKVPYSEAWSRYGSCCSPVQQHGTMERVGVALGKSFSVDGAEGVTVGEGCATINGIDPGEKSSCETLSNCRACFSVVANAFRRCPSRSSRFTMFEMAEYTREDDET
jgi:hypothetical protein